MNISKEQLVKQFLRAKAQGWLPYFREAANDVSFILDAADLMGMASRESNLDPRYLTMAGDRGNAYGLLQIDKRYFPDWVKSGDWKDARSGILKAAEILQDKWADLQNCIGKKVGVRSSKTGKLSYFVGKDVKGAEAKSVLIASYNNGRWPHYVVSQKISKDPDYYTTGHDYSADVIERASYFRALLAKDARSQVSAVVQPVEKPQPAPPVQKQPTVSSDPPAQEQPPKKFDWSSIYRVFVRVSDGASDTLDRITAFQGKVSSSRLSVAIVRALAVLFALFAHYWPYIIAAVVLVIVCEWFMRRTDK